jgi:hypothetical protein
VTLSKSDSQHKTILSISMLCHYADCQYVECRVLFIILLNVILLSVVVPVAKLDEEMGTNILD